LHPGGRKSLDAEKNLHNEENHNFKLPINIIKETKYRNIRCPGHAAHKEEMRNAY
jgi:hypothetical protein